MVSLILMVFALVFAIIAGIVNPVDPWRGKLLCFALACFFAAQLATQIPLLK